MKKNLILYLLIFLSVCTQAQSFGKKQLDLNLGIGLGNTYVTGVYSSATPPLSLSLETGITDDISLGGYIAYAGAKYQFSGNDFCNNGNGNGNFWYTYTDTYSWTFWVIGVRGAYHFAKLIPNNNLDVYAGLMLGDDIASYKYSYISNPICSKHDITYSYPSYGGVVLSVYVGARYRFSDHLGAFAELGYGISYFTLGLNYKF